MAFARPLALAGAAACLIAVPLVWRSMAAPPVLAPGQGQEQAPTRREVSITAADYQFSPSRVEVSQNDLVKVTVTSQDVAYGFTIDAYRVSRRVPPGGSTTLEFRVDRPGTYPFYSNLTSDARHATMRGELVVRAR